MPVDGSGAAAAGSEAPAFIAPAPSAAPSTSAETAPDVLQVLPPDLASPEPGLAVAPGGSERSGLPKAAEIPVVPTQSSTIPLLVLTGLLLVTGIGLAGLRLAARRLT